jgi:putative copper export protein
VSHALTYAILVAIHILAASAWFGAMCYSLAVLHPRARAFFGNLSQFESFITFLAAGARWKVLSGCFVIATTGLALLWMHRGASAAWQTSMLAKGVLFITAVGIFAYASWFAWPARALAAPSEIPAFQKRFRLIAICLITLVTLCFLISVLAHYSSTYGASSPMRLGFKRTGSNESVVPEGHPIVARSFNIE